MVEGRAAPNYNAAMLVQDVGEFELIDLLESSIRRRNSVQTVALRERGIDITLGIGDDAAAWTHSALTVVSTTDTMVDGVHFTTDTTGWPDLGWKAMASNLSDVAAMGCAPTVALVTLGLRGDIDVDGLKAIYSGMMDACEAGGCAIVGGDVARSDTLFVTVALQGVAGPNSALLTRSAAAPGDALAVTGHLGSSAGGLRLLLSPEDSPSISLEAREYLIAAHNRPNPRTTSRTDAQKARRQMRHGRERRLGGGRRKAVRRQWCLRDRSTSTPCPSIRASKRYFPTPGENWY